MSVETVLTRIAQLDRSLLARPAQPAKPAPAPPQGLASQAAFASMLAGQTASNLPGGVAGMAASPLGWTGAAAAPGATAGQRALQAAQAELGQAEQPPGSNDSARIAEYRTATAGSGIGPWCSYFVSWAARQAGAPLGEAGQGFGAVSAVYDWAQRTGRANPAGSGTPPSPGDLIVWDGTHIGIVESVDPDGSITTIEGNSSNMVARRRHGADGDGATGYVRLG